MANPAGVEDHGQADSGFIHAGEQFFRRCHLGFRLGIEQGETRIALAIFITPFPQPGGEYVCMKIYNHSTHYISRGEEQATLFLPTTQVGGNWIFPSAPPRASWQPHILEIR
jgi:hypothetical protein